MRVAKLSVFHVGLVTIPFQAKICNGILNADVRLIVFSVIHALRAFCGRRARATNRVEIFPVDLCAPSPTKITVSVRYEHPRHRSLVTFVTFLKYVMNVLNANLVEGDDGCLMCDLQQRKYHRAGQLKGRYNRPNAHRSVRHFVPPIVKLSTRTFR